VYDDKAISPDMLQASIKLDVSSWWTAWGHRGGRHCSVSSLGVVSLYSSL
jgi:hypothetical protein